MVRYNNININITTSDAQNVEISYSESENVKLSFIDYLNKHITVAFKQTESFMFVPLTENSGTRNDQIYEVIESDWLKKELAHLPPHRLEELTHYMFCFNKINKVFHILCEKDFDFQRQS
jgi:hypothetical protein